MGCRDGQGGKNLASQYIFPRMKHRQEYAYGGGGGGGGVILSDTK